MAIEVGALSLAIESNATAVSNDLAALDRQLKKVARDQQALSERAKTLGAEEKQILRDRKAALREVQKLQKANPSTLAEFRALADAQRRLNQLTVEYARVKRDSMTVEVGRAGLARRKETLTDERAAAQGRIKIEKDAQKEIDGIREESNKKAKAHEDGLGKAHVAARRAETTALGEEARRQSAIQRDIERRVGADRKRLAKVDLAERQTMYNQLFTDQANSLQAQHQLETTRRRQFLAQREADQKASDARVFADRQRMSGVERAQYVGFWKSALAERDAIEAAAAAERVRINTEADRLIAEARKRRDREANRVRRQADAEAARALRLSERAALRQTARSSSAGRVGFGVGAGTFGITGTLLGTSAAFGFVRAANDFQLVQQRLQQVAETSSQVPVLFDRMATSAQRLRVPIADAAELFVKLRQSNSQLGLTFGETANVTDAFSAALRISGATGQTAASALLQFGQAMAKGTLDGDEFRTIAENNSEVLRVLERQLGVTRGEILKMREEKKLTAKMLADSLIKEYDNLIGRVEKLKPTMSQAATSFRNSVLMMIADSRDVQEAMDKIALTIVDLGDALQENGPAIKGIVKLGLELAGIYATLKGVESLGGLYKVLRGGGPAGAIGAVATGAAVVAGAFVFGKNLGEYQVAQQRKEIDDKIRAYADEFQALKERASNLRKHSKDTREILRGEEAVAQRRKYIVEEYTKAVRAAGRAQLAEKMQPNYDNGLLAREAEGALEVWQKIFDLTVQRERVLASGGGAVVQPKTDAETSAAKDTTDEFIRNATRVAEAGQLQAEELDKIKALYRAEEQIVAKNTETLERRAQALDRLSAIQALYSLLLERSVEPMFDMNLFLAENVELMDEVGRVGPAQMTALKAALDAARDTLRDIDPEKSTVLWQEQAAVVKRLADAWDYLTKKYANFATVVEGKEGKEDKMRERLTALEQYFRNVNRQIVRVLLDSPADLVTAYFDAVGQKAADGAVSIGEKMRQAFSSMFGSIGANMIRAGFAELSKALLRGYAYMIGKMGAMTGVFGKFLTAIKKALSNPLIAGPALIAVGAAMTAYSAKMGAAGRGGGGELGGGIGGLSIGGETSPIIYRLADRPYQSPSMSSEPMTGAQPVTVNATIIGPNDPRAQRDIAALVDNAARRGLTQGSRGRIG